MYEYILGLVKTVRSPRVAFTATFGSLFSIIIILAFDCAKLAPDFFQQTFLGSDVDKDRALATIDILKVLAQHLSDLQVVALAIIFSFSLSAVIVNCFLFFHDNLRVLLFALLAKLPIPDKYGILESDEVKTSLSNLASICLLTWLFSGDSTKALAGLMNFLFICLVVGIICVGVWRHLDKSRSNK
jgi:hypothetical protein